MLVKRTVRAEPSASSTFRCTLDGNSAFGGMKRTLPPYSGAISRFMRRLSLTRMVLPRAMTRWMTVPTSASKSLSYRLTKPIFCIR